MSTPDRATWGLFSIHRGALVCRVSRETLRKRIAANRIPPAGTDLVGNALYWIVDLVLATHRTRSEKDFSDATVDPKALPPKERDAWYRSEQRRLNLERNAGKLCDVEEVVREFGRMTLNFAQFLDALPDILERDAQLSPGQVEVMVESIDRERQRLHDEMCVRSALTGANNS